MNRINSYYKYWQFTAQLYGNFKRHDLPKVRKYFQKNYRFNSDYKMIWCLSKRTTAENYYNKDFFHNFNLKTLGIPTNFSTFPTRDPDPVSQHNKYDRIKCGTYRLNALLYLRIIFGQVNTLSFIMVWIFSIWTD